MKPPSLCSHNLFLRRDITSGHPGESPVKAGVPYPDPFAAVFTFGSFKDIKARANRTFVHTSTAFKTACRNPFPEGIAYFAGKYFLPYSLEIYPFLKFRLCAQDNLILFIIILFFSLRSLLQFIPLQETLPEQKNFHPGQ